MADNDISSCVVRDDGWSMDVTVDGAGYAVGATYDFGSLGDSPASISAPAFIVTVVSKGYSAAGVLGTITRTLYGTHVAPLFNTSPDETDTGTGLVIRVALNESIYAKDKTGAGNSGAEPTVIIAGGWCTSGANVSNAVVGLAVTNNSTRAYPKVIAQWAWGHTPAWHGVEADYSIGCIATHGHGIACVALSATDAHSNAVSGVATIKTKHLMSASGLYYESYDLAVPIVGFTAGDDVTLKFIAYPLVGDADSVIDTSTDTTSTDDCLGLTQITCRLVSSVASYYVASADHPTTPGSDAADGASATPFLTIGHALDVLTDGAGKVNRIYAKQGGAVLGILGATPASVAATGCFIEVMPNPGDTVTLNRGATYTQFKATKLKFIGFTITGNNWLDGGLVAGAKLWFDNCTIDPTTPQGTVGLGYRSEFCNITHTNFVTADTHTSGATRAAYALTGCLHSAGAIINSHAAIVATKLIGTTTVDTNRVKDMPASGLAPLTHNLLFMNSEWLNCYSSGVATFTIADAGAKAQIAFIGNIIEVASGEQPALVVGANSVTDYQLDDIVIAHNTVTGQRSNMLYNEVGTTAVYRNNCFVAYNAMSSYNCKGWWFGTPSENRIGNQAQINGVNIFSNRNDGTAGDGFTGVYDGINVAYVLARDSTFGQMNYTDDASQYGDASGQGNYLPTVSSALYNAAPAASIRYQSYDLFGNAV